MLLLSILLASFPVFINGGAEWHYIGEDGPLHWHELNNGTYKACSGAMQSPIGIDTTKAIYDPSLLQFNLKGFSEKVDGNMRLKNNGHTVQVDIFDTSLRTSGGGLTGSYQPVQFHFHWGHNDTVGSEHYLDGKVYPMEMHVVHYSDRFSSINDAVDKPDGLVVLGFFFETGTRITTNYHFEEVFQYLKDVEHQDTEVMIPPVVMHDLLPRDLKHFFRYRGSLTTPPCYESVVWTVFNEPIRISHEQMRRFREMIKKHNPTNETQEEPLVDDFRPLQQLNDRSVYSSFETVAPKQSQGTVVVCANGDTNSGVLPELSFLLITVCAVFKRAI